MNKKNIGTTTSIKISKQLRDRAKKCGVNVSSCARGAVLRMVEYQEKVARNEE